MNNSDGLRLGTALGIMGISIEELDSIIKNSMVINDPNKNRNMILSNLMPIEKNECICDLIITLSHEDGGEFLEILEYKIDSMFTKEDIFANRHEAFFPLNIPGFYKKNDYNIDLFYFLIEYLYHHFRRYKYTHINALNKLEKLFEMSTKDILEILKNSIYNDDKYDYKNELKL